MYRRRAGSGGFTVTLSSNNGAAQVPAGVTVSAGNSTATFTISTSLGHRLHAGVHWCLLQ